MPDTDNGKAPEAKIDHSTSPPMRSKWSISEIKRKLHERTTQYKDESASDKAQRRTTTATVVMAIFTAVLAVVGVLTYFILKNQLREMHEGGADTHDLAVAAGKQADAAKILAEQAKAQTGRMDKSLEKATEQAIATNNLASQAKRSADIARDAFKASNRPYVGVGTIIIKYLSADVSGVITFYDRPVRQAVNMDFSIETKNYGTVPALEFEGEWKVWFDGIEVPGSKVPDRPSTLFPGQSIFTADQIGTDKYADMIASRKILEFEANISYRDASARYSECSRHRFAPNVNGFMDLGACEEPRRNTKHENPN